MHPFEQAPQHCPRPLALTQFSSQLIATPAFTESYMLYKQGYYQRQGRVFGCKQSVCLSNVLVTSHKLEARLSSLL